MLVINYLINASKSSPLPCVVVFNNFTLQYNFSCEVFSKATFQIFKLIKFIFNSYAMKYNFSVKR